MRYLISPAAGMLALFSTPLHAADGFDASLEVESRAVYSERTVVDGDSIEATGIGGSLDSAFTWKNGRTAVQFDLGAATFAFADEDRDTRTSLRAVGEVSHKIAANVTVSIAVGHWDDITTLEARRTDQHAVRAEVAYENRPHRMRVATQYREREYEATTPSRGTGMRFDVDYTYRFGSWHWARVDLRAEDIDSTHVRRGYERYMVRAGYSAPLDETRLWRFRPQIEWRSWEYDGRRVLDDPAASLRKDGYVAPEIGLSYGKLEGLQGRVRAAYQFRVSNDPRFRSDAPYVDVRLGYRF